MTLEQLPAEHPGFWKSWLIASRPKTLPAAAAPAILGSAAAFVDGSFQFGPALAALAGALLLQIGANIANDYFDYKHGADAGARLGPLRVTQSGLLTPRQVIVGIVAVFGLATLIGVYLITVAGTPVAVMGLLSIMAALAYTGGPYPLGYNGLGEVFVFIFFGLVATCGTYYVQTLTVSAAVLYAAISIGLLISAILVVNNLRDLESDRVSGKRTQAVRLGERGSLREYNTLLLLAYLVLGFSVFTRAVTIWALLALLSAPRAWMLTR
ncbi:MAG TPA: 1,4-dihydroxy-2-naphthoate polyprenyltransferase, partial [Bellilinea sp.]|nr:1,4-dihydroxy-2-naphthoate polyprenyltransferase [Bellilinea sp.]